MRIYYFGWNRINIENIELILLCVINYCDDFENIQIMVCD